MIVLRLIAMTAMTATNATLTMVANLLLQSLTDLTQELESIITSKVQVPLKPLLNILNKDCRQTLLATWVTCKQCQIKPLIYSLVRRYHDHDLVLPILRKLSQNPQIAIELSTAQDKYRLSIIQDLAFQDPVDDLSDSSTSWQSRDATQSLSQPSLPDAQFEVLLATLPYQNYAPVELANLVTGILGNKAGCRASVWNRAVKLVLESQPLETLSNVDEKVLQKAYTNWKVQMQSRDNYEAMTSIHIASSLAQFWDQLHENPPFHPHHQHHPRPSLPPILETWIALAHEFFKLPKGPSTAKATFLRSLKAVVDSSSYSSGEHAEMVAMGRHVMASLDRPSVSEWNKDSGIAAAKLSQKMLEVSISPLMRINAFCVLASAFESASQTEQWQMFATVEPILLSLLRQEDFICPSEVSEPKIFLGQMVAMMQAVEGHGHGTARLSSFFGKLVPVIFNLANPSLITLQKSIGTEWALLFMSALASHTSKQPSGFSGRSFCTIVRDIGFPEWWAVNNSKPGRPKNCAGLGICPHIVESRRQRLCIRVSRTFNDLVGHSNFDERADAEAQLQLDQATPERSWNICQWLPSTVKSLPVGNNTPLANIPKSLSQELRAACAEIQAAAMLHVEERCHILRERCENIEKPLTAERTKVAELERTLDDVRTEFGTLQELHQHLRSEFSRAREHRAYQTRRAIGFAGLASTLRRERQTQQVQHSHEVQALQQGRREDAARVARLEAEVEDAHEENEAQELARRGEKLLEEEMRERLEESIIELEEQVSWQQEEMARQERELAMKYESELAIKMEEQERELMETSRAELTVRMEEQNRLLQEREQRHVQEISTREEEISQQASRLRALEERYQKSEAHVTDLEEQAEKMSQYLAAANGREKRLLDILQPQG
ncbi:hypothetical protein PV10_08797 [Exophiala mesophila]|uniref:Uncharacterized protein n=1 Tax=Exophiala mesophila TaxID=212818 RepID=A0A0D1WJY0_EXOME|nr:uncharacterized protein PV10_08797 [Exophiala mesophila]KIV89210.1 hypothetical protein PV10_08797 [Exophiala mesophila]